jgi:uncharacterized hydrophobic protein (TIGR00271 family)
LLGNHVEARSQVVLTMLHRDANESMSYWLQLVVAAGIATLGLVVGSAAVVIGAMLIAPLMGPIIGLAMGLATGSPFLVLRSTGRIVFSVIVTLAGAAAITLLLPFHELNGEISARATPTVLDLITAAFCALAGVYASLRPGSDTASTAAGTSIGISLVPPLCASGYGLGTLTWSVAAGAALLFLTNLVAIVAVGSLSFLASGFDRVEVARLERQELAEGQDAPVARYLARRLARIFESRLGPVARFLMPFALLGAVYVPLRRALDEVAWEVKVRTAVRDVLAAEPRPVVESKSQITRHTADVVVVLLGTARDAEATRGRLLREIQRVAGVKPSLEIVAVPDATAFAGLESTLLTSRRVTSAPAAPAAPAGDRLNDAVIMARDAVAGLWPESAAGELLSVAVESAGADRLGLKVAHAGNALDRATLDTLSKALSSKLERPTIVLDFPFSTELITRAGGDLLFMQQVATAAAALRWVPNAKLCLRRPPAEKGRRPRDESRAELSSALDRLGQGQPGVVSAPGEDFEARLVVGECPAELAAPPSASTPAPKP